MKPEKKAVEKPAAKETKVSAKPVKEVKVEKTSKVTPPPAEKKAASVKAEKASAAEATPSAAPVKKEKKVKIDKTGLSDDQVKWAEYHEKYKGTAPTYSISGQFEAKTPLQHKIFGWGFILSNEYDRLEVLFEDGKRMLISNRKL